jgi:type IV pilus assembly protein PilC
MLNFKYIARDPSTGEKIRSEVQAENEQSASRLIQKQGYAPIEITLSEAGVGGISKFFNKVKIKDKILFSRQLSTLINAGLPLVQSLRTVANQTQSKPLKVVVNQIVSDIEGGSALSAAMARHPDVFNQVYVSLIAAGEASGTLDAALERLSTQQEKDAEIMAKVRGAMVYPVIVLVIMFVVMGFMLVKVLPQVQTLYDGIEGQKLPLITSILLAVSNTIIKFWWVFILVVGILAFFGTRWMSTLGGKRFADKAKMKMWPIGPLFMKLYMARFARTGTTLVASGVPLIRVLEITSDAINNIYIAQSLKSAIEKVKGGKALSDSLHGDPNFLPLVPDMLKIGEQSGAIEDMLARVAEYYEKEVDTQIKTISTIIEPLLMVILGIFAFIIVAAVLLPVYGLAGKTIIN